MSRSFAARGGTDGPGGRTEEGGVLRRVLGPIDATCVVVGAIIGVGIFFTPSRVALLAGSAEMALLAWAVGGLIALCGALTFAELGVRYPRAGGQYEILRDAYGTLPAFLFVFCNATAVQAGAIAIIALLCAQNLSIAAAGAAPAAPATMTLAGTLIAGVTLANVAGVRWGAGIQNLTVAAKLATLMAVTLAAAVSGSAPDGAGTGVPSPSPGIGQNVLVLLFAAIVPSFFAYGGWQHALWMAGEVRDPHRNLPRAIVGGVVIVLAAYLLVNWAYLQLLGYAAVTGSQSLAADAVARVWPQTGRRAAAAAVAVSAFGVLNAQLLSGPRLIFRMAEDGRFFRSFARVQGRLGTPLLAILLLAALGLSWLLLSTILSRNAIEAIDRLTTGVVFVDGVFFALTGLSLFVLSGRRDQDAQHQRAPGAAARAGDSHPAGGDAAAPAQQDASGRRSSPPPRAWQRLAASVFVFGETGIILGACADPRMISSAWIGLGWIAAAAVLYALFFRTPRG